MERLIIKNKKGLKLVAHLYAAKSEKIIVFAHGFTNDQSSDGRFDQLAIRLCQKGFNALTFDFSGSGESDDDALTSEHQKNDLEAVIKFVLDKGYSSIALLGNSFGTLACLKNYSDAIKTMVLIGALTDKMTYDWESFFSKEALISLKNNGHFDYRDKRSFQITQETLDDFEAIDQMTLLTPIKCPVLIIHGDHPEDLEELQLLEHSKAAIKLLSVDSALMIVKNAKHGLRDHWNESMCLVEEWYQNHL